MAMMYANENFPMPVVEELRRLSHDVLTIQETGKAEQSVTDEDVLAFASADRRSVLILNRKHFVHLHNAKQKHEGIIVCSFDPDFLGQARRIHTAIVSQAKLSGRLIRVNRPPL